MDSILQKVLEIENLGFNYVLIIHDSKNKKAILRCSQAAHGFIDETSFLQEFIEYFKKYDNFKNGVVKEQGDYLNDENIPINKTKFSKTVNSPQKQIVTKLFIPTKPLIDFPQKKIKTDKICFNKPHLDVHKKPIVRISKIYSTETDLVNPKKSLIEFNNESNKDNSKVNQIIIYKDALKIDKLLFNNSSFSENNNLPFQKESKEIKLNNCPILSSENNTLNAATASRNDVLFTNFDKASTESQYMLKNDITDKNAKSFYSAVDLNCEDIFDNERFVRELNSISYKCLICGKAFKTAYDAEMHCWKHEKIFKDSSLESSEINLNTRTYQCNFCQRFFADQQLFKLHTWTHTNSIINKNVKVELFECPLCNKMYLTKDQLKRHNFNIHIDGYSTCSLCSKIFRSRKLKEHMRTVHFSNKVKCPKCPKVFKRTISLRLHLQDHDAKEAGINNTFLCNKCNKSFVSGVRLQIHTRINCTRTKDQNSSILCPICGNNFSTNLTLSFHLRLKHSDKGLSGVEPLQKIKCKICNQFFPKSRLKDHFRSHSNEKQFNCETCGKSFKYNHSLKKHKKNRTCL